MPDGRSQAAKLKARENPAAPVTLGAMKSNRNSALRDEDPLVARASSIAQRLEGLTRHAGTHAAGVVISGPATERPRAALPRSEVRHRHPVRQEGVDEAGLVKFDFLGLKTLTVIDIAEKLVNARPDRKGMKFDVRTLPLDDRPTDQLISSGDTTVGVFQLESEGMQQLLRNMKPDCFEDIIALVALYRPGPHGT